MDRAHRVTYGTIVFKVCKFYLASKNEKNWWEKCLDLETCL